MDRDVLVCICASFSDVVLFDFQALESANIISFQCQQNGQFSTPQTIPRNSVIKLKNSWEYSTIDRSAQNGPLN